MTVGQGDSDQHELGVIDASDAESSERWELPSFDQRQRGSKAKEEAEAPKLPTAQEIAAIREAAYEEGMQQGLDAGRQQAKQELAKMAKQFEALMQELEHPFKQQEEQLTEEFAELAMMATRHIIRRELLQDPQQIIAVIRDSIKLLPSYRRQVMIQLHPEDANLVREIFSVGKQQESSWIIADDPSIARGGCLITTDTSRIDATLEKRIAELFNHIFGDVRRSETRNSEEASESAPSNQRQEP